MRVNIIIINDILSNVQVAKFYTLTFIQDALLSTDIHNR